MAKADILKVIENTQENTRVSLLIARPEMTRVLCLRMSVLHSERSGRGCTKWALICILKQEGRAPVTVRNTETCQLKT